MAAGEDMQTTDDPDLFDEAFYLQAHPDVDAAVKSGWFASARQHYDEYGRAEGRVAHPGTGAAHDLAVEAPAPPSAAHEGPTDAEFVLDWDWLDHPMVRERMNALASGDPMVDAYDRLAGLLRQRGVPLPLEAAVSLGCGSGGFERGLAARGIVRAIDAYDPAPEAVAEAERLAEAGGFAGLRYHVADLDHPPLAARAADVVFAHLSVHHLDRLEALFGSVEAALRPGGVFHLFEFVSPGGLQWSDAQVVAVNQFLAGLPPRLRCLPSGQRRPLLARPAGSAAQAARSSEIVSLLERRFDGVEVRWLGGCLLHPALSGIAQNFDPGSAEDRAILEALFAAEDAGLRDGTLSSDFAVITAAKHAPPPLPPAAPPGRAWLPVVWRPRWFPPDKPVVELFRQMGPAAAGALA